MSWQIGLGSAMLILTTAIHITLLALAIEIVPLLAGVGILRETSALAFALAAILVGHTFQVWLWAFALRAFGALSSLEQAVYFALVTLTTLGYGDVTLDKKWRIFGAMAAVNGLLTFGLSTAFFVGAFSRIFAN